MRSSRLWMALVLAVLPILAQAGDNNWTGHGPFMTNFNLLEISHSNPDFVYAGNSYAFLKSTDSGLTWSQLACPSFNCMSLLKLHPHNIQIAYAVDGQRTGLLVTKNGGKSWATFGQSFEGEVGDLEIDPRKSSVLYLAKKGWTFKDFRPAQIFRSTDSGRSWATLFSSTCCLSNLSGQIELNLQQPNILYAAFDKVFLKSTDAGNTWNSQKIAGDWIEQIKADPGNGNILYLTTNQRLWRSSDAGATWARTQNTCIGNLELDQKNPGVLYTTGKDGSTYANCSKQSTDFGITWTDFPVPRPAHLSTVLLRVNPRDGKNILASSDLFYRTRDGGSSWRIILNGKGSTGPWQLASDPSNLYAYGENRIFRSSSGTGKWILMNSPKDFEFWQIQVHPREPDVIVAAGGFTPVGARSDKSFLLSTDAGKTWNYRTTPFPYTAQVLTDARDIRHFLVASPCPSVYRNCLGETTNGGITWSVRQIPGPVCCNNARIISTGPDFTIYALSRNHVLKSVDWGKTWSSSSLVLDSDATVGSLAAGPKYIYASVFYSDSSIVPRPLYRSDVQNPVWEKIADVSPLVHGDIPTVWPHPTDPNVVFMSGSSGLIVSYDAGLTWRQVVQTGLPHFNEISGLLIAPGDPMTLYGTFLTGVLSFTGTP